MRRLALVCLLVLTACQKKDPEGTLTFKAEKGKTPMYLYIKDLQRGDSAPIRILGGDLFLTLLGPVDLDEARSCSPRIDLIPYGEQNGQTIYENERAPIIDNKRINGLKAGVYFLRYSAPTTYCKITVSMRTQ